MANMFGPLAPRFPFCCRRAAPRVLREATALFVLTVPALAQESYPESAERSVPIPPRRVNIEHHEKRDSLHE
jgi:hypothetical protein